MTKFEEMRQRFEELADSVGTLVEEKERIDELIDEKVSEINSLVYSWLMENGVGVGDKVRYTYTFQNEKPKRGEGILDFDEEKSRVIIGDKEFDEFVIFKGYVKIEKVEE